ncbi:MAG: hypothetical protein ACXV4A_04775 [Actinomycetes bacterium]
MIDLAEEPHLQRAVRFVADLMGTLAEGDVHGAEAAAQLAGLWAARAPSAISDLDTETLLAAFVCVASTLAQMLATERHDAGRSDACSVAVWRDLAPAWEPGATPDITDGRPQKSG